MMRHSLYGDSICATFAKYLCKWSVIVKMTLLGLCVVLGLSGCGLIQRYQQQEQMTQFRSENQQLTARCDGEFQTEPRLDPIRPYINFGSDTDTIEQLASTKKPNANEKQAILVWDEMSSKCTADRLALYQKFGAPAGFAQNLRNFAEQQKGLRADLWAGKITYGQFLKAARINQANLKKSQEDLQQSISNQHYQRQLQQAQIEAQQQQAAAAVMSAQAQQQSANNQTMMMFNQAQQQRQQFNAPGTATNPVQTNCNQIGNRLNCQTYSY